MSTPKSDRITDLEARVSAFVIENVYPAEAVFQRQLNESPTRWAIPPVMEANRPS
jgi:acyl-CoA dehydrogenase